MSRPRRASDPTTWPEPCGRCSEHHQIVASWPDARICGYCYQAAKRRTGTCPCGHQGVLPGLIEGQPACRSCTGIQLNVDCQGCGAEAELHSGGRCWTCVLTTTVERLLTNPNTGAIAQPLQPVAAALKSMNRANSGLTWINQKHVSGFLTDLAASEFITHESLDALPPHRTRDYVRGLLVEHGALPRRDERLARYHTWSEQALQRLPKGDSHDVARRFIRWHLIRRMNAMDQISEGTFLRSKQTATVAIEFLKWIADRGTTLKQLTQADLDAWQAGGPTTREFASRFLQWAIKSRLTPADIAMTPHRRGTSPKLGAAEQDRLIQEAIHGEQLNPRDRFAAILVLVFGQRIEDAVRLTWNDTEILDGLATVTLGATAITLPVPLDQPLRDLATRQGQTAAHPNSPWIFPGQNPGHHITGSTLRERLKKIFSTRAARLGTLHEMTKATPIPIIAEVLGYSPATIERHAVASASTYARYIGATLGAKRSQSSSGNP